MVDRFQTFDGDANLFSGLNEDGDMFVLLRNIEGYETDSQFIFVEEYNRADKKIVFGEGKDSVTLMDADGMLVELYGNKSQINSMFNCYNSQKPVVGTIEKEANESAEQNLIEYVVGPAGPKGDQGYAGADGRDGIDGKDGVD